TVQDLFAFFEPWRVLLRDAAARLEAVSPALVVEPIRDAVASATDASVTSISTPSTRRWKRPWTKTDRWWTASTPRVSKCGRLSRA
ncbi:hypothetical protein, partial [Desulfosarcina cetonica]|uniref:hypothetical protein n=1 Tax=Desulfosarcina cetonica TaxID=90730 RepID=UPI001C450CCE